MLLKSIHFAVLLYQLTTEVKAFETWVGRSRRESSAFNDDPPGTSEHLIRRRSAVVNTTLNLLWPRATLLYSFNPNLDSELVDKVQFAMTYISSLSCVKFVAYTTASEAQSTYGHSRFVSYQNSSGPAICFANVGWRASTGAEPIYMGVNCSNDFYHPTHLILHSLGFYHEHQRPDRDDYVIINQNIIIPGVVSNYNLLRPDWIVDYVQPYDISSIMHFRSVDTSQNPLIPVMVPQQNFLQTSDPIGLDNLGGTTRPRTDPMSFRDKAKINALYQCAAACSSISCLNGGYQDSTCRCLCPRGFIGSDCGTFDQSGLNPPNCGGIITSGMGVIMSTNYPQPYASGTVCKWLLINSTVAYTTPKVFTGRICVRLDALSLFDSQADALRIYINGPEVDSYPIDSTNLNSIIGYWVMSETNVVTVSFTANHSCSDKDTVCNLNATGFQLSYNIGCQGLTWYIPTQPLAWSTNPNQAYLALWHPPQEWKAGSCLLDLCVSDGNCPLKDHNWDTFRCGCSAIAGVESRTRPQYYYQQFVMFVHTTDFFIRDVNVSGSFEAYTMAARLCNFVYAGFNQTELGPYYRSTFNDSVWSVAGTDGTFAQYSFGFNVSFGLDVATVAAAFNITAAIMAPEQPVDLFSNDSLSWQILDFDECASTETWRCPDNVSCINTQGRYTCNCPPGSHYEWSYGARQIGQCVPGFGSGGPGNYTVTPFQWWWLLIGAICFVAALLCCLPICVWLCRRRRVFRVRQWERSQQHSSSSFRRQRQRQRLDDVPDERG